MLNICITPSFVYEQTALQFLNLKLPVKRHEEVGLVRKSGEHGEMKHEESQEKALIPVSALLLLSYVILHIVHFLYFI